VICLVLIRTGQLPVLLVFVFLTAGFGILGFVKLHYLFVTTVLLLPFESLMVPDFPLNVQLALLVATLGLVMSVVKSRSLPRTPADRLFLAYLAILAISILQPYFFSDLEPPQLLPAELGWRASPHRGWYHLFAVIIGLAVAYFTILNITSSKRLKLAAVCLLSTSLAVSLFSFYEAIAKVTGLPLVYFSFRDQDYVSLARYSIGGLAIPRVYGSAGEPLSFGNFLIVPFSLSIAFLLLRQRSRRHRIIFWTTLASLTLAILLTFSTSAWFGAIVSLCVILLLVRSKGLSQVTIPFFVLAMLVFFSPLGSQPALQSISESQQHKIHAALGVDTRDFRYVGLQRSLSVIERFPVLGVGLGNEPFWMNSPSMNIGSYNILLSLFVETGAIGCFFFLYLIVRLVRLFLASRRRATDPENGAVSLGCAAALLGCLASHMAWGGRLSSWEWFVIGLGLAAYKVIQKEQTERLDTGTVSVRESSREWQTLRPRYAAENSHT
jgi:O-antigen ligase